MKIERYKSDDRVLVVTADEGLNEFGNDAPIREVERRVASEPGIGMVVVVFSALEFLGSGGIGNLLHLQKHLAEQEIALRLAGLPNDQAEVLRITRVSTMIEMFPNVESAVGAGV